MGWCSIAGVSTCHYYHPPPFIQTLLHLYVVYRNQIFRNLEQRLIFSKLTAMKKIFIFLISHALIALTTNAQSVGINTTGTAPTDSRAMLEVLRPNFSKIKIRTVNYFSDTTMLEFTNRQLPGTGSDMRIAMIGQDGLFFSSASTFAANTNDSLLAIRTNGNIGMGINNPTYKLHLHAPTSNNTFLNFTNNITGITNQDGLVLGMLGNSARLGNLETGELRFGTSNLTRALIDANGNMGIGTTVPAYKLDVAGDINMTGTLRLNGTAGAPGQVLTSNGISDPTWQSSSHSNNVRFSIDLFPGAFHNEYLNLSEINYNYSPADVTIGANVITINKAGLYHFEGFLTAHANFSAAQSFPPHLGLSLYHYVVPPPPGTVFLPTWIVISQMMSPRNSSLPARFELGQSFSIEVYVEAGEHILLWPGIYSSVGTTPSIFGYNGNFRGHLISE